MISVISSPRLKQPPAELAQMGLRDPHKTRILYSSQTNDTMTRYQAQIKADRRAAAAERRAEIQATGKNEITERRKLYNLV